MRSFRYLCWLNLLCFLFQIDAAIKVPLRDYNEWGIVHLAAAVLPKKNLVIVQAGAHHRDTFRDLLYFWPNGSIHVFEPSPQLFHELEMHSRMWNLGIYLYPFALNETGGEALYYFDPQSINPRTGSLLQAADPWKWYYKESSVISVRCENLQEWAYTNKIPSIDFLWLNVGGLELSILKSIPDLLSSIQFLVVETHFQEFRLGAGLYPELKQFLQMHNFEEIQHWHVPDFQGYAIFTPKGLVENSR